MAPKGGVITPSTLALCRLHSSRSAFPYAQPLLQPLPGTPFHYYDARAAIDALCPGAYAALPYVASRVCRKRVAPRRDRIRGRAVSGPAHWAAL